MRYLLKLNMMGVLYALALLVAIELVFDVYRISRLTGWELGIVTNMVAVIIFVEFVGVSLLFILLTRRWMESRKSSYWSAVLWVPYLGFFVYLFASLFPIENPGEVVNPGIGLVLIGVLAVYPFYVAMMNFIGVNLRRG